MKGLLPIPYIAPFKDGMKNDELRKRADDGDYKSKSVLEKRLRKYSAKASALKSGNSF